jgi:hypothetical protein
LLKVDALAGRTILAKHLINAAKAGERDPHGLADSAILYLARQKLSRKPPETAGSRLTLKPVI